MNPTTTLSISSRRYFAVAGVVLAVALGFAGVALSAEEVKTPQAKASTTSDPDVPVDHLKLLVQPLTLEEVTVEADAWRDLVKEKTIELNAAEIASRRKREEVAAVEDAAAAVNAAENASGEDAVEKAKAAAEATRAAQNIKEEAKSDEVAQEAEQKAVDSEGTDNARQGAGAKAVGELGADEIKKDAAASKEVKSAILESLTGLRDERAALIERLNVVVADFENKGGDPVPYRNYISAVSGLNVEVTDTTAVLSLVRGWLTSSEGGIKWLKKLLSFVAIVFAFYLLAGVVGRVVRKATSLSVGMSDLMRGFINRMVRRIILIVGVVVALGAVGFNVGAMLALIGGGAFIIGFALQDTLGNLANGIMLLFHRPFDKGDFVEVAGISGTVESVTLVSTNILTPDNKLMIVPNKKVWGDTITNVTGSSERRVDLVFGIGYEDDIDEAQQILESVVADHELVMAEPAPVIRVHELADSSVNFVCRPWTRTGDYWTVYWDVTRAVKQQFDKRGISIPYPQQDVHLHRVESDD